MKNEHYIWKAIKHGAAVIGCMYLLLMAVLAFGAWCEGLQAFLPSMLVSGFALWLCRSLWRFAENELE